MKPEVEWKKVSAELLILSLVEARPRHGYEISKLIGQRSKGAVRFYVASLYPLPYRLEKRALDSGPAGWKRVASTGWASHSAMMKGDKLPLSPEWDRFAMKVHAHMDLSERKKIN